MEELSKAGLADAIGRLEKRLAPIEKLMPHLEVSLGLLAGPLAAVVTGGGFPGGLTATSTGKAPGGNACNVVVEASTQYVAGARQVTRDAQGNVTKICVTYDVTVTVSVKEDGCPPGVAATPVRTTTHTFKKIYCDSEQDTVSSGASVGFDGLETDTISFGHGTKVKVERGKPAGKSTVTVTYPDGTSATTTLP